MKQFRIAFYIRCSTEEQGLHANPEGTIKNQEQRLRYEVEGKNRALNFGEVVGVFVEDGLSAKDTKRPALQRMLKSIELGEINLVMVTEYSRLSRSMRDFSAMWELFKSYKCSVISLRENFDTSTAAGEMMLYNMANLAQYERRMTSERVIASRIDRSRRGLFNGGIIPLGYKKADRPGYLEVDEEEAKIVQIAFSQFLKIGTILRTAKWLNENNIHLPLEVKGSGKSRLGHFTVGNLRFLLTNKAYIGITTIKKAGVEIESKAVWPGLVDNADFYKIQEVIKGNFQKKKPHQNSRYPYTLSGLVFCKRCGEVMCGKSAHGRTKKVGYYEHSWSMRKDAALTQKSLDCGMHRRVPAKIIEALIHEKIEELLLREEVAVELIHDVQKLHKESNAHNDKEKKLKKELTSYSAQLETLAERLAKLPTNVPADEIYKTMRLIGEKKEKVSRGLDVFSSSDRLGQEVPVELKDYEQFVKAMKVMWFNPESNAELKEKIIKKFIARIEIDLDKIFIDYWMGKGFYQREIRSLDLPPVGQVLERAENLKILGSSTLQSGGGKATTDEPPQFHDFIGLSLRTQDRIFKKCAPLYEEGRSLRDIEEKTGIARSTIRKALQENGFALRNPNQGNGKDFNSKNRKYSGGVPYGWVCFDGKLVIDPKEQLVIRQIMKLRQTGAAYNAIAKHLNAKKVPTRLNGKWRDTTIKLIINRQKKQNPNGGSNE